MDLLTLAAAVEAAATTPKRKRPMRRKNRTPRVPLSVMALDTTVEFMPEAGTGAYVRTALDKLADNAADPIGRGLWVA